MIKKLPILLTLALSLSAGCTSGGGGGGDSDGACGVLGLKITNGEECGTPAGNPVVLIIITDQQGNPGSICTGTMITNNDILTAAHCLPENGNILVNINGNVFPAVDVIPHPNFDGEVPSQYDAGIVKLAAPQAVSPVPLLLSRSASLGDKITAYGYGVDENGESAAERGADSLKAGRLKITDLQLGVLVAEFEDVSEDNTSVCFGDSGGPAILEKDGALGITGISNAVGALDGGSGQCTLVELAAFTDIFNVADFVLEVVPDALTS